LSALPAHSLLSLERNNNLTGAPLVLAAAACCVLRCPQPKIEGSSAAGDSRLCIARVVSSTISRRIANRHGAVTDAQQRPGFQIRILNSAGEIEESIAFDERANRMRI
jgi:hypothetical protein